MKALPIDPHLIAITDLVKKNSVVILSSTPGSGKTTRLPPELLASTVGKILVLEPRRIAASMAAQRIADERNWSLGKDVGFQVRFENRTSSTTRLVFLTEALLLKKMISDPTLSEVGLVIFDEFHERSIFTDTGIALMQELLQLERPDLKLLIMSATLEVAPLLKAFPQAATYKVETPIHPLEIELDTQAQLLRTTPEWVQKVVAAAKKGFAASPGQKDVLVFLPGVGEIERVRRELGAWCNDRGIELEALHGSLSLTEQQRVLNPSPAGRRRFLLATNVAESSVTVDGLDTVVDTGLEKISQLHHRSFFPSLALARISKSSAKQRAGRAARQGPGKVLQLWSRSDELSMPPEKRPEIQRTDLSDITLLLSILGHKHPESLPWIDGADSKQWSFAIQTLTQTGCWTQDRDLTPKGKKVAELPFGAVIGSLVIEAESLGKREIGLEVAALLQAWQQGSLRSGDFGSLWEDWKSASRRPEFAVVHRILQQLQGRRSSQGDESLLQTGPRKDLANLDDLLWRGFHHRLARVRRGLEGSAVLFGGVGIELPRGFSLKKSPFFLALEVREGGNDTFADLIYELPEDFVRQKTAKEAKSSDRIELDRESQKFWKLRSLTFFGVPLGTPSRLPADGTEVSQALSEWLVEHWDEFVQRSDSWKSWFLRWKYFLSHKREPSQGGFSEEQKTQFATGFCSGENSVERLFQKDVTDFVEALFDYGLIQEFRRQCPTHLKTLRGRSVPIEYRENLPPLAACRIQDAFGWPESPKVLGVPLVLDLLAPNGRPQQRTQDLANFWKSSYLEVRKDLRARYPKHAWPEDPFKPPEDED